MEIRVLRYFLAVVREENITKAAEILHITQPTLSRQIAQAEEELGVKLFARGTRRLSLTTDGLLLRRRAEEILELVDKTERELAEQKGSIEGTVALGCGDLGAVELLPELLRSFRAEYPLVRFELYTATAEHVKERMDRGVTDVGLLLEPVNLEKYEGIRVNPREEWVAAMAPDSPLAQKEAVTAADLKDVPLILPQRVTPESPIARWFGEAYSQLQVLATSNLPSTTLVMVRHKLAYSLHIKGSIALWDQSKVTYRPLSPALPDTSTMLAWKRGQPFSPAVEKFIQHARAWFAQEEVMP